MLPGGPKEGDFNRDVMVLSLDAIHSDQDALIEILSRSAWSPSPNYKWILVRSANPESAMQTIRENTIPILVCGCDQKPDTWKLILESLTSLTDPPALIVTSRTADERLWAEALNLGAYDVLAKPFDRAEVVRTLNSAWLHWWSRASKASPKRMRAAS